MDSASQATRILRLIRQNNRHGTANYALSRISLKYSSRISELRQDGYNIYCERDHLPNGRATNVFRYFLNEEPKPKKPSRDNSRKIDNMTYEHLPKKKLWSRIVQRII